MTVPDEYTNALNALKAYRTKILTDLVGGRVIAGLEAGHDSMLKYGNIVDGLNVVPYLMGYIRHRVVALKFKGKDIGLGSLRDISADYIGKEAPYPTTPPYEQTQRNLPQVDYFLYTPLYDIELLDKTNVATLQSALLVQADSGTFRETPDIENALYDYYIVYPNRRRRNKWSITNPTPPFTGMTKISGDHVRCLRELVKDGTYEHYLYGIVIWLDGTLEKETGTEDTVAFATYFWKQLNAPDTYVNIVGQRLPVAVGGLWGSMKYEFAVRGFGQISTQLDEDAPTEDVWINTFKLTIQVNDEAKGHTVPAVGEYKHPAGFGVQVTAYPHATFSFDHWERDGVTVSEINPYSIAMYKDFTLKAVFV